MPAGCAELTNFSDCLHADRCMSVFGTPFKPAGGCEGSSEFLACLSLQGCDDFQVTVCRDGTDEKFQLPHGCVPPGFTPCDAGVVHLCGDCDGFAEADCTDENACHPEFGSPLVEKDGEACFDLENQQYLGCLGSTVCNDASIIVCLDGQPEQPFRVPSDCGLGGTGPCDDFPPDAWICM